ncbi:helix-turn-helix domain-containing protein [Kitasatospora phosalacinea]|uniref:helix-turn-helix domain-containing protein n=1 Tax=Kitasatospora phosalacinea TaxID=2065 RepID=UPI0005273776|nr:helix-turn-helix transcriptional regulator [Kitasatospora phosalacinea]
MNIKPLTPEASPRDAFGAELRRTREELGISQSQLAARAGYSPGHISAVETGRKPPTLPLARKFDQVLEAGKKFSNLFLDVRTSSLLRGFSHYMTFEAKAVEVRVFEIGIIPGLLQTSAYAAELVAASVGRGAITEAQGDERLQVLANRQKLLTREPVPPQLYVVLDESCIRRPVGGPEAMVAQLDRLLEVAALPNVTLQIAPYSMGASRSLDLPVHLLRLPDHSVAAYSEAAQEGLFERDPAAVHPLLSAYHHLQVEALTQAASRALISKVREELQ